MLRIFKYILLVLMFTVTVYTRFVSLNWDRGWGFHPDENNLWGASRSIKWFSNLDPKFYAYGGLPVYLYSFFNSKTGPRAISAMLQTGIIGLLYLTGRKLKGERTGFLAASMGIFSAGLTQAAHFLTVESLIGFFGLMIIFSMLKYSEGGRTSVFWLLLAAIVLGMGIGTKISFGVFALLFFGRALIFLIGKSAGTPEPRSRALARHVRRTCEQVSVLLGLFIIAVSIFFLTNPFIFAKLQDIKSTLRYETNVAMGRQPVFYTRQFIGTVPGWFQLIHVFPFITGWLFIPVFLIGGVRLIGEIGKNWVDETGRKHLILLLAVLAGLLSFLPMWAKWTRYVVQILPILILVAAIGADWIWEKGKLGRALVIVTIISFLPQFFSTMKVYGSPDNRLAAADWAAVNIPKNAKIFTESMDLGIIPFNPIHGENITLFNFYELDEDKTGQRQILLNSLINESDYFISVSNRVYGNSFKLPDRFPASADFYRRLFDGSLGFKKIYESPSIVIPAEAVIYLNRFRVKHGMTERFSPEETFQVFDHPTIMIFQKKS